MLLVPPRVGCHPAGVGLFDRLKSFAVPAQDADAVMPRWARIARIDREAGQLATVEMEIHYGNAAPFTYTDLVRVPTGLIWVGQDVAVRRHRPGQHSNAGSGDVYEICYGEPPHYRL
jgi:hypothetical protein